MQDFKLRVGVVVAHGLVFMYGAGEKHEMTAAALLVKFDHIGRQVLYFDVHAAFRRNVHAEFHRQAGIRDVPNGDRGGGRGIAQPCRIEHRGAVGQHFDREHRGEFPRCLGGAGDIRAWQVNGDHGYATTTLLNVTRLMRSDLSNVAWFIAATPTQYVPAVIALNAPVAGSKYRLISSTVA